MAGQFDDDVAQAETLAGAIVSRAILVTVIGEAWCSRAVARMPRPSRNDLLIASARSSAMGFRPLRLEVRRNPARMRSLIKLRSSSENTDSIPKRARPDGVLLSRPCWCR